MQIKTFRHKNAAKAIHRLAWALLQLQDLPGSKVVPSLHRLERETRAGSVSLHGPESRQKLVNSQVKYKGPGDNKN